MKRLAHATLLVASVLAVSACASGRASHGASTRSDPPASRVSTYSLRAGQTRSFASARPGDTVRCVGSGGSLSATVPARTSGGNRYALEFNRKLSLQVGPLDPLSPAHRGGVTARCKARSARQLQAG